MFTIKLMNWLNGVVQLMILTSLLFLGSVIGLFIFGFYPSVKAVIGVFELRDIFDNNDTYSSLVKEFFNLYLFYFKREFIPSLITGVIFILLTLDTIVFVYHQSTIVTIPIVILDWLVIVMTLSYMITSEMVTDSRWRIVKFSFLSVFMFPVHSICVGMMMGSFFMISAIFPSSMLVSISLCLYFVTGFLKTSFLKKGVIR